jgi:hypothetical protein
MRRLYEKSSCMIYGIVRRLIPVLAAWLALPFFVALGWLGWDGYQMEIILGVEGGREVY